MDWLAALRYGPGPTTVTCTVSLRPWTEPRRKTGGSLEVASGAREVFTIRTIRKLAVVFRVKESELPAFRTALEFGMDNPGGLTFYPNGVAATGYAVYVVSPAHEEDWEPQRTEQMGGATAGSMFDCPVVLEKVTGASWDLNFYAP